MSVEWYVHQVFLVFLDSPVPTPRDFASFQRTPKLMSRVVLTRERIRALNFNLTHLTDLAPAPSLPSPIWNQLYTRKVALDKLICYDIHIFKEGKIVFVSLKFKIHGGRHLSSNRSIVHVFSTYDKKRGAKISKRHIDANAMLRTPDNFMCLYEMQFLCNLKSPNSKTY